MMVLYVFVLAIFVGFELISKVPPTLHTPLMSGSNAISGITILGAIIVAGKYSEWSSIMGIIGFFAVLFGALNVYGGYWVTDRMLKMLIQKDEKSNTLRGKDMNLSAILSSDWLRELIYLISVIFFIFGLKMLSSPNSQER